MTKIYKCDGRTYDDCVSGWRDVRVAVDWLYRDNEASPTRQVLIQKQQGRAHPCPGQVDKIMCIVNISSLAHGDHGTLAAVRAWSHHGHMTVQRVVSRMTLRALIRRQCRAGDLH